MVAKPVGLLLRRRKTIAIVVAALIVVFLVLTAVAGDDEEDPNTGLTDFQRGPDIPLVIAAGEPIVIGVSSALTGPIASLGLEYRDAVVVAVQQWMEANGEQIGGHAIRVVADADLPEEPDAPIEVVLREGEGSGADAGVIAAFVVPSVVVAAAVAAGLTIATRRRRAA